MTLLERAETLLAAITLGDWTAEESVGWDVYGGPRGHPEHVCALDGEADAEFIAASPTLVRELVDALTEATALLREMYEAAACCEPTRAFLARQAGTP